MNEQESLMLCRLAKAMCPQQAMDEYTPDAWHLLLGDLRFVDAKDALVNLGRRQPFIAPSEVYQEVRRIRNERIRAFGHVQPPPGQDEIDGYHEWLTGMNKRIGDGLTRDEYEREVPPVPVDPVGQERVRELLSGAFQRVTDLDETDPDEAA